MYNNSSQYPNSGYQNTYPQYEQSYSGDYYQNYGYQSAQPAPPGGNYPQNNWSTAYGGSSQQTDEKNEAVAQEMQQQKAQLVKQRDDYVKKATVLRHELDQLRNQKQELLNDGSSDRDLALILKENDKLQDEIQGKMKAIYNVIEMLSSIIKDGKKIADLEASVEQELQRHHSPTPNRENYKSPTPIGEAEGGDRFCYVFYDTGLHWCRNCDEFPETAKGLLQHLQGKEHQESAKENDVDTTPWHKLPVEPVLPSFDDAPKKRIPIKGLQFFISAPSWYCKLCDVWIGDLHCASHHLKSQAHFQNYENFVQQNPHWEMEWLKDREKAMTRNGKGNSSDSDDEKKNKKRRHNRSLESLLSKEKKKKKRSKRKRKHSSDSSSSSSSSDSSSDDEKNDRSKSIRVAMRNISKVQSIMSEDMSKWSVLEKLIVDHRKKDNVKDKEKPKEPEDELINQWMTVSTPIEKEKHLLDSLKDRMRAKQEIEKAKYAEGERRRKEKEREEQELYERRQFEARQEAENVEREKKRREQEEFQRLTDKDRSHVRFKTTRENYRKRRSPSKSEDEEDNRQDNRYMQSPPRYRRDSEKSDRHREKSKSRSRSIDRRSDESKKKPPGPPSYKKLPFIGRMPLFKNRKIEEKQAEQKELIKEDYEPQRRTRFEPGTLPRAFMPQPDVVCFPRLSSIPPLATPPPPVVSLPPKVPEAPKITEKKVVVPPAPKIAKEEKINSNHINEDNLYSETGPEMDPNVMGQYYQDYNNMMYSQMYDFPQGENQAPPEIPLAHTMPLQPPPLPPDDDLALLGICADDMAAQSF